VPVHALAASFRVCARALTHISRAFLVSQLGERTRLLCALEAAAAAPVASSGAPRAASHGGDEAAQRARLRVLEDKLAALQRKLKDAAAAEASRRAGDERRAADAKRLGDDISRMKAARVELVRRMERDAKQHADAQRAGAAALGAERRAGRRAAAALAAASAAAARQEAVLRRKTEEVAAQSRLIKQLKSRAADSRLAHAASRLSFTAAGSSPSEEPSADDDATMMEASMPAAPAARAAWLEGQLACAARAAALARALAPTSSAGNGNAGASASVAARWAGVQSLEDAHEMLTLLFDAAASARAASAAAAARPRVSASSSGYGAGAGARRGASTPAAPPRAWDNSVSVPRGATAAATRRGLRITRPASFALSPKMKGVTKGSGGGGGGATTGGYASATAARARAHAPRRWRAPTSDSDDDGAGGGSDSESGGNANRRDSGGIGASDDADVPINGASSGAAAAAAMGDAFDSARLRFGAAATAALGWALRTHATPARSGSRPPFVLDHATPAAVAPMASLSPSDENENDGAAVADVASEGTPKMGSRLFASVRAQAREQARRLLDGARSPFADVANNAAAVASPQRISAKMAAPAEAEEEEETAEEEAPQRMEAAAEAVVA
jgi:hypothetical protein